MTRRHGAGRIVCGCSSVEIVQAVSEALIERRQEMPVSIKRDPYGRVPEALLDLLRVGAMTD